MDKKYNLIGTDEIDDIPTKVLKTYYTNHVNMGVPYFLSMLGFDSVKPVYSEGMYIHTSDNRKILDFTGGISVLNLGHNHPRIMAARRKFNEKRHPEVWKAFLSPYLAVLSKNLSELSPGDLNYPFFCNSGAEANEGAMKIAQKFQGPEKSIYVYTDISFHGKTHATMSVSGCEHTRTHFKLLDGCIQIPYGNWTAFEDVIKSRCKANTKENDITAIILEAIHAEGVAIPPAGYLKNIRRLCDEYGIVLIIDDVFCGFGRTGKIFSFEHEDVIPDVYTVSKSLGGGKASIAAYVVRDHIYKKAYGSLKDSMIHTTTFNGLGEECYTAIEALNVLIDENLVENSRVMGAYFLEELVKLQNKYPDIIKEVRGIGLLINVELMPIANKSYTDLIGKYSNFISEFNESFLAGVMLSQLLYKSDILVFTGQHVKNIIFINPSLIVKKEHIDYFVKSFDALLSLGIRGMLQSYIGMKIKKGLFSGS